MGQTLSHVNVHSSIAFSGAAPSWGSGPVCLNNEAIGVINWWPLTRGPRVSEQWVWFCSHTNVIPFSSVKLLLTYSGISCRVSFLEYWTGRVIGNQMEEQCRSEVGSEMGFSRIFPLRRDEWRCVWPQDIWVWVEQSGVTCFVTVEGAVFGLAENSFICLPCSIKFLHLFNIGFYGVHRKCTNTFVVLPSWG